MQLRFTFIYLFIAITISACVPVAIVGVGATAAAKNNEKAVTVQENKPKKSEIAQEPFKAESPPPAEQSQEVAQLNNLQPQTHLMPEVTSEPSRPNEQNISISELVNRSWEMTLYGKSELMASNSILYFDGQNNYFGFDGCRYFKGRYESKGKGQLLIKSLTVAAKGSQACENTIMTNLIFIDAFNQDNDGIQLTNKGKLIITLRPKENLDSHAFLSNAKLNTKRKKSGAHQKIKKKS